VIARTGLVLALVAALGLPAGCVSNSIGPTPPTASESAASINLRLGIAYLQQGQLALAKEKLDRALKQNPRDPNAHSARALLSERLGDIEGADRGFRTALRLAPDSPDVVNSYAVFLCRNGRVDEGVERFRAAARNPLYTTPEFAYTNAGVCLRGANRLDEAAESFSQALQVRPNHTEAILQLGDLELLRNRPMQARIVVEQWVGAFRPAPEVLLLLVRICRAQGDRACEDRYSRRLRVEFPDSAAVQQLPSVGSTPAAPPRPTQPAPQAAPAQPRNR